MTSDAQPTGADAQPAVIFRAATLDDGAAMWRIARDSRVLDLNTSYAYLIMARDFGEHGVRVNALLPGGTDTPMGRAFTDTPESLAFVQQLHALKRLAQPEEIARSALYLASDASSFTTGIALLADGGVSICRT